MAIRRSKRKVLAKAENEVSPTPPTAKKTRSAAVGSLQEACPSNEVQKIDDFVDVEVKRGRGRKRTVRKKKAAEAGKEEEEEEGLNLEETNQIDDEDEDEDEEERGKQIEEKSSPKKRQGVAARVANHQNCDEEEGDEIFCGDPVGEEEAKQLWPHRYERGGKKSSAQNGEDVVRARRHYRQAKVDGCIYNLNDDAYVKAGEGEPDYIGRIVEFFETIDHQLYFTAQWFFRAEDTVIKEHSHYHDPRRVFLSDEKNDNTLSCIVKKLRIVRVTPKVSLPINEKDILGCDLYYDMSFSVAYSSFENLPPEVVLEGVDTSSTTTSLTASEEIGQNSELSLLDIYSGCGAMSTGLCLGANLSGVKLQTRWAVDINGNACKSLKFNHPETEVRNEKAEDFLAVLREWVALCKKYGLEKGVCSSKIDIPDDDEEPEDLSKLSSGVFEVGMIVGICYGKTENLDKDGLKFKVRWKGFGPEEDTWEPVDGLSNCEEKIKEFVVRGFKNNILPLPGTVDVICGGPPCQGISGFNRFREYKDPFKDEKNKQMLVFMDIIEFLKPKFVLMENVVDILKFAKGLLGRYALSRLVSLKYQARLGILAAGNYGLPQYRMRVFLWGAQPTEKLPQFPLPTHDVVVRGGPPVEFETHVVAFDGSHQLKLEKALLLADAIFDLPPVVNNEIRDEMPYGGPPQTDFQRYIRLTREEMLDSSSTGDMPNQNRMLFDHRPLKLNQDDYDRVCQIPKHKGANFRNLPGVIVGPNNIVEWDPNVPRVLLRSGKPLVPDYAMTFIKGRSPKPFGRLWWDETVPTVVTRAEPHNQIIIHPEQDRVLSIRENARLQGFPDYYKLFGSIKARYIQVGNAVAVPVSRALGYGLGWACLRKGDNEPVFALPQNFPINS